MIILDEILASIQQDAPVRSVLVGAHWTVVCSRYCGMAATMMDEHRHGQLPVHRAGCLHNQSARQLAEYARSDVLLEASIGMAAVNSLLDVEESKTEAINAVDVLIDRGRGRNLALVGHFPFVPKLRSAVGQLWVIEQNPSGEDYPADAAADLIPRADVVAITSSAFINHTFDGLLALCRPDALVMALGPSTPFSPVLFTHGVAILSGSRVRDESAVLRCVGQGANFQQVEGVRLLTIRSDQWNLP